jgi:bacterioferritin-associated ferredoxin
MQTTIDVDGNPRQLWFEVENEYAPSLCHERSDGYLIGLLPWAMRHQHDITCEMPVGEELYYQITSCLIPALCKSANKLYSTQIFASIDTQTILNKGAIGTGISCGIDSLHVLANQSNSPYPSLNLTHLVHHNVGSHGTNKDSEVLRIERENRAQAFADEMGYKLIKTNSNYAEIFQQTYPYINTYANCFAIYMMQKLWSNYFYASLGCGLNNFNLKNHDKKDSAYYDLLTLDCLSTKTLRIYSEGAAKTRFEKTKTVVNYLPAKKYLNVCCATGSNCGKCEKCMRTLLMLDALDTLDTFNSVFDINYYKTHKNHYYAWLCLRKLQHDAMLKETFNILAHKLSVWNWMVALKEILFIGLRKIPYLRAFYKSVVVKRRCK